MAKKHKTIRLFTGQSFEEDAIELLRKYEPGPVYILSADTPEGEGIYLCSEPFTLEEAEDQNILVPEGVDDSDGPSIPFDSSDEEDG